MQPLTIIRKFLDAVITALAVFFGLIPDPTMTPVEVERDPYR